MTAAKPKRNRTRRIQLTQLLNIEVTIDLEINGTSHTAKNKMSFFKILAPTIGGRSIGIENARSIDFCPQRAYSFK